MWAARKRFVGLGFIFGFCNERRKKLLTFWVQQTIANIKLLCQIKWLFIWRNIKIAWLLEILSKMCADRFRISVSACEILFLGKNNGPKIYVPFSSAIWLPSHKIPLRSTLTAHRTMRHLMCLFTSFSSSFLFDVIPTSSQSDAHTTTEMDNNTARAVYNVNQNVLNLT